MELFQRFCRHSAAVVPLPSLRALRRPLSSSSRPSFSSSPSSPHTTTFISFPSALHHGRRVSLRRGAPTLRAAVPSALPHMRYSIMEKYAFVEEAEEAVVAPPGPEKKKRVPFHRYEPRPIDSSVTEVGGGVPQQPRDPLSLSVSVVGEPNTGKSTLVNALVNHKVGAVSSKAQTTRERVLAVHTEGNTQLVFLDTPGMVSLSGQKRLQRSVITAALDATADADLILAMADITRPSSNNLDYVVRMLSSQEKKGKEIVLIINKMDLLRNDAKGRAKLNTLLDGMKATGLFTHIFLTSAMRGTNLDTVKNYLMSRALPEQWAFSAEMKTDRSLLEQVNEIVREKIYQRYNLEVPYVTEVRNIGWTTLIGGCIRIDVQILTTSVPHQKIVVGREGEGLRFLKEKATKDIQALLKQEVMLVLQVKSKSKG
eukprot:TRINITY_DN9268_c0_g1_i2.p1 TRINITY_DN9268_c0_g1~~TRINITY_DN9268_c0_g1_i2.p1  ORF type:complete len:427 (-),score=75.42 TRINITY_DN9268_c0_g1_i2:20-1300(-)